MSEYIEMNRIISAEMWTVKMYLRSFRQSLRCRAASTDDDRHVDE